MVQRGSDPVSGPSNEFYSNFPFTAHQSRIVPQACCVNPLAQHPVVNSVTAWVLGYKKLKTGIGNNRVYRNLKHANKKQTREDCCIVQVTCKTIAFRFSKHILK